jgi:hypothetical protein
MISAAQKSRFYFDFEDEYFVENQGITKSNEKIMRTGDQKGHVNKNIATSEERELKKRNKPSRMSKDKEEKTSY